MWESFFIALVQGITEFLPISSAAHLIITHELLGWAEQALIVDIAAHAGTLAAALLYFRKTMTDCLKGLLPSAAPPDRHLLALTILASLPVLVLGAVLFFTSLIDELRSLEVIAVTNLFFACLLFFADRQVQAKADVRAMTLGDAVRVGLLQACALIPGASRAGSVITAMRFLGYQRAAAAQFALFLALPAIGAAFALALLHLDVFENLALFALIGLLSFLVALAVLHGFIKFSRRFSLLGFVVYRLALSALLFIVILT